MIHVILIRKTNAVRIHLTLYVIRGALVNHVILIRKTNAVRIDATLYVIHATGTIASMRAGSFHATKESMVPQPHNTGRWEHSCLHMVRRHHTCQRWTSTYVGWLCLANTRRSSSY